MLEVRFISHEHQLTSRLVKSDSIIVGENDEGICDEFGEAKECFHGVAKW